MGSARTYLAAFAGLHTLDDADERRRVARQGLAVLAQIAEREPAPLEGISGEALLQSVRAALEGVLSAPLTAPGAIGEVAVGLLAQPSLAQSWIEAPASGSLPARRLAARILAHGAREAVRRLDGGDRGGVQVLVRPGVRAALRRLLGDREALVWRFAGIARGMLAH